jgi:polysaccharide biosynthesis protein PslG
MNKRRQLGLGFGVYQMRATKTARDRLCGVACIALATGLAAPAAHALPYGINAHVPSSQLIAAAAAAGLEWVRIDLNWDAVQPSAGQFDWTVYDALVDAAEARGLNIYATLGSTPAWATKGPPATGVPSDSQAWYTFCFRAAQRYRGRIEYFGLWNEPNLSTFWAGDRNQYIEVILKTGSRAVHDANPRAKVCGPELAHLDSANWDGWLLDVLGRASDYLDVVTHHIYPTNANPASVVQALTRDRQHSWEPRSVREVLRMGGWQRLPFWLTETGYDSHSPEKVGETIQALFVSGLLSQLFGPSRSVDWVQKVFFYELSDDPQNPGSTWGWLGPPPDYRQKPAVAAYGGFATQTAVDDAEVVSASMPAVLRPGEQVAVSVTVRNTGTTTWTGDANYHLGAVGDHDTFAAPRQDLGPGDSVRPGGVTTFTFRFLAPAEAADAGDRYLTRWQMVRDGFWWFGGLSAQSVAVTTTYTVRQVMHLPAIANSAGLNGTRWRSDLSLFNAGPEPAEFSVVALEQGQDNSWPLMARLTLAPGMQQRINDVLASLFRLTGTVALRLDVVRGNLFPVARSYTPSGNGTCGQGLPELSSASAVGFGNAVRLVGLLYSADRSSGSRTNLGFLNLASQPITVQVDLFADDATTVGSVTYDLPPFGFRQVTDIYRVVAAADVVNGTASVQTLTPGTAVIAYASVVNNQSGEATLIAPPAPADEPLIIVTAAHNAGLQGSLWRSDLELFNPGPDPATFAVELLTSGTAARPPAAPVTLQGMSSARVPDVVGSLFGIEGSGALRITPGSSTAAAFSTTYNAGSPGRLGQAVPAALQSDAAVFGEEVRLLQLSGSADRATGFRTNIGFVNVSGLPITVEVDLYRSPSTAVGTLTATLAPLEWRQITDVFRLVSAEVNDGFAVVRLAKPGGRFLAYASVIDNASGDPFLVQGR